MAVFFKRTNARLGRLIGAVTVFIALAALADGFVVGATTLGVAGVLLFVLESGRNSAVSAFLIRALFLALALVGIGHIIG